MTRIPPLTPAQMEILEFERTTWPRLQMGAKASDIYTRFGVTETVYLQRLNGILDLPAALVYDPTLVRRLLRLREDRRRAQGHPSGRAS